MPTEEQRIQVRALAGCGLPHEAIATYLGLTKNTVRKAFKEELETGGDFIHAAVSGKLVQKALTGHPGSIFFLLERRFGWTNRQRHELTGADGKAINFANVPDDQLAQVIAALSASVCAGEGADGTGAEDVPGIEGPEDPLDSIPE